MYIHKGLDPTIKIYEVQLMGEQFWVLRVESFSIRPP